MWLYLFCSNTMQGFGFQPKLKRVGFSNLSLICFTCFSAPVSNILFLFFLELQDLTVRIFFYHTFSQKMSMILTQTADETKHRL